MLYLNFLFILSLHIIIIIHAGFIQDRLFDGVVMHVDRLDGQCGGKKLPYQMFLQGVKTLSTKATVENCTFVVKEGGFKNIKLTIIINRCRSKENLDTCEQYFKQPNIDFCTAIDPDNVIISKSPLFLPFEPPVKCPINKGIYHSYNMTFDLAPFIFFKLDGFYWKIKAEMVFPKQNKLLYCIYLEGYVTNYKSKTN